MKAVLRQWMRLPVTVWRMVFGVSALVILALALAPSEAVFSATGWDKTNHLLAFSVLALLGFRAYPGRWTRVILGLLAYGGLIEIFQSFTPDRAAEWSDVLADSVGLGLGYAVQILASILIRRSSS